VQEEGRGDGHLALRESPVLVLDAQATAAHPSRGALVEVGWARWSAGEPGELAASRVTARVVAAPAGADLPRAVQRLTGLDAAAWRRGAPPVAVWSGLRAAVAALPAAVAPAVVHFARFEEPHLRALHARHGTGPFPLRLVCTHAIARRLLPELPRRTLRALAGYFGAAVAPLRRSADHVAATAFVWRHLVARLDEQEGITTLEALDEWLARPARRAPRRFPLARERRLALPDRPGVYRLLRAGGAVLYVGKAASLRHRVSGHYHARGGERALEMLTQVRDVAATLTATALEAALLEADEIKRLAPPYNVALAATGRAVWFARRDLEDLRETPDEEHPVGPLASPAPFEALSALRAALRAARPLPLAARARAAGVDPAWAPPPSCFAEGLARFAEALPRGAGLRDVLRLGARRWAERRAATGEAQAADDAEGEARGRPAWDAERVALALEETALRAAHAVRRSRWLVGLSESALAWTEPGRDGRRLLVVERGAVTTRAELAPGEPLPIPPGHGRPAAERRRSFDVAGFDRLRVLTTELRPLALGAADVELRLGRLARLTRRRLRAVLRWV
jgi:DNA polymerase-3 subunit epsilon